MRATTSPPTTTRAQALARTERLSALTHLVSSLEHLASPAERRPGGMNNWEISREATLVSSAPARRLLDVVGRPGVTAGVHCVRVAAAAALLAPTRGRATRAGAGATLAGTSLLLHPRHHYGTDGSDQVAFLVQALGTLGRAAGGRHRVVDAALWTVGLQSTMSYAVSGWAKLAGPTWRSGRALEGVTRTLTYGDPRAFALVRSHPRAARAAGAAVLALESVFPLALLGRGRLARPLVAGVTTFHLSVARVMALGRFVPAFTSMHPAVLYVARDRAATAAPGVPERDDTVARLAAAAAVGLVSAAALTRRANAATVRAGRGDEQVLRTTDGNALSYRRWGRTGADTPVVLLESGLLSTPEHWEHLATHLAADAEVLTYHRAGYGPSTARPGTALVLDDLVGHAAELLAAVAPGRPVVLVGHSLGGVLALRTAVATSADVRAVVLVDSSHPDELRRSQRQAHGADGLTAAFPLMATSLELGLGGLLAVPGWVTSLPPAARATALAQYRDARLWRAARREWTATLRDFGSEPAAVAPGVPVLAVSAGLTLRQDEVQGELHRELAALGSPGRHEVLRGADHDTILSDARHAGALAALVTDFLAPVLAPQRAAQGAA